MKSPPEIAADAFADELEKLGGLGSKLLAGYGLMAFGPTLYRHGKQKALGATLYRGHQDPGQTGHRWTSRFGGARPGDQLTLGEKLLWAPIMRTSQTGDLGHLPLGLGTMYRGGKALSTPRQSFQGLIRKQPITRMGTPVSTPLMQQPLNPTLRVAGDFYAKSFPTAYKKITTALRPSGT